MFRPLRIRTRVLVTLLLAGATAGLALAQQHFEAGETSTIGARDDNPQRQPSVPSSRAGPLVQVPAFPPPRNTLRELGASGNAPLPEVKLTLPGKRVFGSRYRTGAG